jgi:hypothetical protein
MNSIAIPSFTPGSINSTKLPDMIRISKSMYGPDELSSLRSRVDGQEGKPTRRGLPPLAAIFTSLQHPVDSRCADTESQSGLSSFNRLLSRLPQTRSDTCHDAINAFLLVSPYLLLRSH